MDITLKDIITISGHGGLFTSIKPIRHGLLVESLNDQKKRSIKQLQDHKTAALKDMNIYAAGTEEMLPSCTDLYGTPDKLHELVERIASNYALKRAYVSGIKKIIHRYNRLVKHTPQIFDAEVQAISPDSLG